MLNFLVDWRVDTPDERTFQFSVVGSNLRIIDTLYLPEWLRDIGKKPMDKSAEANMYMTDVSVPMYDDRFATFEDWLNARLSHMKIQVSQSEVSDRQLFIFYDNGPYVEVTDDNGEIVAQDGGNFGFAIDLGMPGFAEWTYAEAPLHNESPNEYRARLMERQNLMREFLGDDGPVIDVAQGTISYGRDLPSYTEAQIEAVRNGG